MSIGKKTIKQINIFLSEEQNDTGERYCDAQGVGILHPDLRCRRAARHGGIYEKSSISGKF